MADKSFDDRINEWLRPMFRRLGRENVTVNITGTCGKGESFLSDIHYVEVKDRDTDQVEFNLVVKSGKRGTALRHLVNLHKINGTERTFYVTILPLFRELITERRADHLGCVDMIPEYFHSHRVDGEDEEEVLVLQDVKKLGHKLYLRAVAMNVPHLKHVLKAYARFHAVTFAFRRNSPTEFSEACKKLGNPMKNINLELILDERAYFERLAAVCDDARVKTKVEYLAEMTQNSHVDGPASCIIHGDCDITNYMFKYNVDATIEHVFFLDWQFARLAPVIYDLSYFLFACMSPFDLRHFDDLKEVYFNTFRDVFVELGFDQRLMFTREEYEKQWLLHARYGLRMMCSVMKNQLSKPEEFFDFEVLAARALDAEAPPGSPFLNPHVGPGPTACSYSEDFVRRCTGRLFPFIRFCMERAYI